MSGFLLAFLEVWAEVDKVASFRAGHFYFRKLDFAWEFSMLSWSYQSKALPLQNQFFRKPDALNLQGLDFWALKWSNF